MNLFTQRNRLTDIENKLMVTKGERFVGSKKLDVWDQQIHATMYKIDKLSPTVQHRELYSIAYNKL